MITYDQISIERTDKAVSDNCHLADKHGKPFADAVGDAQWAMVEAGEADMDAAFVLAMEAAIADPRWA